VRLSVRTKQVAGVTAIVFAVVACLGAYYMLSLAGVFIEETRARADLIAGGVYQRIAQLTRDGGDLREAIRTDAGLRSILESSMYSDGVMYAAVVDAQGVVLAHNDPSQVNRRLPPVGDLAALVDASAWEQSRAIAAQGGQAHELRMPLMLDVGAGVQEFGTIRVAVSTLLIRSDLDKALRPALVTTIALLFGAVVLATLLAQWLLRPILVLRAGLARLGRGDTDVTLDLPLRDEFADLGESFMAVRDRLAKEHADGEVSRAAMSRRLAALGRVSSGIAHEVKNPLNAMRIHLELLRMQTTDIPGTSEHVRVLNDQMRRLDEVVQGFLSFTRPEDLTTITIPPAALFEDLLPVVTAEAGKTGVQVQVDVPAGVPAIAGDRALLHQAFLNLAINACHAMPNGGHLRLAARTSSARRGHVELLVEDTGTGISPEHLSRIFNLYFTTKPEGSGIGLALVYRTVTLHDGDIDVQSVPGSGTTFTVTLPSALQ